MKNNVSVDTHLQGVYQDFAQEQGASAKYQMVGGASTN